MEMGRFRAAGQRRHLLLSLAWLAALVLAPLAAQAGSTYKCQTADGGVAYVNNHLADYKPCVRIADYADSAPATSATPRGQWVYGETRADEAPPTPPAGVKATAIDKGSAPHTRILTGTVYKVMRKDGIAEYTNIKPGGKATALFHYIATCVACDVHSSTDWSHVALNLVAFSPQIEQAAVEFGVDASLLRALIHAESAFDPEAVSAKGAQGLTQLMPATAGSLGVADPFDATQNIRGGARYLAQLLHDFNGDERLATAAYNAGEAAVRKYNGVPPYAETQVYVERVGLLHQRYRAARAGSGTLAGPVGLGTPH
jgi:hypothetical protein